MVARCDINSGIRNWLWRGTICHLLVATIWCAESGQKALPSLEALRNQYQSQLTLLRQPVSDLNAKYLEALNGLSEGLQAKGQLEGVLAVRAEVERFKKDPSPVSEVSSLEVLARLQGLYAEKHQQLLVKISADLEATHDAYQTQLGSLVRELTTRGNLKEAVQVKAALDSLLPLETGVLTLETDLVLHFRFDPSEDEAIADLSGTGNHGRLMGDAELRNKGDRRAYYVSLDGKEDYVETPHHDSLVLTTDATISVWIRPKEVQRMRGIVSKYTPAHSWVLRFWKDADFKKISFGDYGRGNRSKAEISAGQWTHVVVTLKNSTVKFYFDGELDSEGKRPDALQQNNNPVRIGSDCDGRYFTGDIDDVRIYRRALSAKEVARLFRLES